jgi:tryptophan synthase alpha chain
MNHMQETLLRCRQDGKKILVGYFPLADPAMGDPVARVGEYLESGVDVLELGLPYEKPVLDGAVVRDSTKRALGVTGAEAALKSIGSLRQAFPTACLQIMTYHEIVEGIGLERFCRMAKEAGADGAMSPNASSMQAEELGRALEEQGLIMPRFAPFHLDRSAATEIAHKARGYVFVQAQDGKTGAQTGVPAEVGKNISLLRSCSEDIPLYAGFGISCPEQIKTLIAMGADGVIVGSSIISAVLEGRSRSYIFSLRAALDG